MMQALKYLKIVISKLSDVKLKDEVFMGSHIRRLIKHTTYCCQKSKRNNTESLERFLLKGFLGN